MASRMVMVRVRFRVKVRYRVSVRLSVSVSSGELNWPCAWPAVQW